MLNKFPPPYPDARDRATTAAAVTTAVFHVLNDKRIRERVMGELREAWPDPAVRLSAQEIEKLPYLVSALSVCGH